MIRHRFSVIVWIVCVAIISLGWASSAQEDGGHHHPAAAGHDHEAMMMEAMDKDPEISEKVAVEEQLGKMADLNTVFADSKGRKLTLETVFDKPVVLLPIYFTCTSVCNFLQADLAKALNHVDQIPGKDFNIVTLSFDDDEDPSIARTSKQNYTNLLKRDYDPENWYHLTGDMKNIRKLTDSLGYYFIKESKHVYIHPSALVVLGSDGKIIRYLYGRSYLPFDLSMAIGEAQKGEPGVSIKRGVLSFCFAYDTDNKTYVFKTFRIAGSAILILALVFVAFLAYPSKKRKNKKDRFSA